MKRNNNGVVFFVISVLILVNLFLLVWVSTPVEAQDTAPVWEYGALITEGESGFAFTADLERNNEINKLFDAMDDEFNVIVALNVMGAEGWEFVESQNAGAGSTLYMFKRPG